MRKILVLLLLICFMAFPSIAGATSTSGSDTANVTVTYLSPVSLSLAVPAGTIHIKSTFTNSDAYTVFTASSGWISSFTPDAGVDIQNNGLSVFQLTGSAGQQVTISVDNMVEASGATTLRLEAIKICLASDNSLHNGTSNCCGGGSVSTSNSVTATIPSSGSGYFAIRPDDIWMGDASKKGNWTLTITVTADY